jgi:predicted Mrr-cat superfamily restriction endonuclease
MEMQFREDINRLDHLVKESKKAAAQQVLEITLRAKAASEEVDELKAQRAELVASEKKAYAEVEKVKIEAEMNKVPLTHSLTHSLNHSLTLALTHSLTHSCTHSLAH